ncbi:YhgE/Pip domain-containing protein [Paenibacillus aquistagni]|uniref:Putative membrane protein n=1 Tax=Paenibacillus aquistagni TaxID=1852522 RepID=A0A1X7KT97_9BACL|nr:YhgE/Pip domain-containing protein [Paenibacillus aquistagni]SMG44114.1 putative membrane protein [Paenibacillus aquistagni]
MKNIWTIYRTDIRRMVTNWPAAIIIGGLIVLPSLYAWFNIVASWDPYSNTKGIQIAVVNQDAGTTLIDQPINVGKEIVAALKENHDLGWTFVDQEEALHGVKHGSYYASIIIPQDMSARIGTILTNNPEKAIILYVVNEKINAIAPKITDKGASTIIQQVSSNFVETANGTIFKIFHAIGLEIEHELPSILKARDLILKLDKHLPELNETVKLALVDVEKANKIITDAKDSLPVVQDVAQKGKLLSSKVANVMEHGESGLISIAPLVKQDMQSIADIADSVHETAVALQMAEEDPSVGIALLNRTEAKLSIASSIVKRLIAWHDKLQTLLPVGLVQRKLERLHAIEDRFAAQTALVQSLRSALEAGEGAAKDLLGRLDASAVETASITNTLVDQFDTELIPAIESKLQETAHTANQVTQVLNTGLQDLPDVAKLLQDASKAAPVATQELHNIQHELPSLEQKVHRIADDIRDLESKGNIQEVIDLLLHDVQKESQFFAQPVELKEQKLYPIPNYGSAMTPFYTILSLWVGALLLVSLLSVDVHEEGIRYKNHEVYAGRYLTFLTCALLQTLICTLGDLYVLHTYAVDKLWFVLFGLYSSAIFMLIVYSLVSVFGNVGKAMAIVMLVLQVAGSGGTFPIQMLPQFFQRLYPFLPFSYSISLIREATGGILWDIVYRDLWMLLIFAGLALLLGLVLKSPINRGSAELVKKAKDSRIIH